LRFGLDESVLAPLFTASNFMLLISYLLAPRISDTLGTVRTIVISQAVAIVLLVVIPVAPSYPLVGILFVFRGLLMNMVNPLVRSMILGMVHAEERATASGVLSIAWTVPNSATPSVGGYIMDNLSLSLPFYLCGVLYGVAVSLFFAFFRRTR
jgi:MFS family permease